MKKLLVLLAVLALMLAACNGDDDDDDDNNTQQPTADQTTPENTINTDSAVDAETALVALFTGNLDEAATYFCADDADTLETIGSGFPAPIEGQEITADCELNGETVTCSINSSMSGVDTPMGNYALTVVDGKLCDLQATQ